MADSKIAADSDLFNTLSQEETFVMSLLRQNLPNFGTMDETL